MKNKVYAIVRSETEIDSIIRHFRPDDRKDDDSANPHHLVIHLKDDGQQAMRDLLWHLSETGTIDYDRNNRFAVDTNNEVKNYAPRNPGADRTSDIPLIFLSWEGAAEASNFLSVSGMFVEVIAFQFVLESLGYAHHN